MNSTNASFYYNEINTSLLETLDSNIENDSFIDDEFYNQTSDPTRETKPLSCIEIIAKYMAVYYIPIISIGGECI